MSVLFEGIFHHITDRQAADVWKEGIAKHQQRLDELEKEKETRELGISSKSCASNVSNSGNPYERDFIDPDYVPAKNQSSNGDKQPGSPSNGPQDRQDSQSSNNQYSFKSNNQNSFKSGNRSVSQSASKDSGGAHTSGCSGSKSPRIQPPQKSFSTRQNMTTKEQSRKEQNGQQSPSQIRTFQRRTSNNQRMALGTAILGLLFL